MQDLIHLQVSFSCPNCRQREATVLIVIEQVGDREDMPHAPWIGDISAKLSEFGSLESAHRS